MKAAATRPAAGMGHCHACPVIRAAAQRPPITGPVRMSARVADHAGLARRNASATMPGLPNSAIAARAAWSGVSPWARYFSCASAQPAGDLLGERRWQPDEQVVAVGGDQAVLGHGVPSSAAVITAAKSRQSARRPESAFLPASVSA